MSTEEAEVPQRAGIQAAARPALSVREDLGIGVFKNILAPLTLVLWSFQPIHD